MEKINKIRKIKKLIKNSKKDDEFIFYSLALLEYKVILSRNLLRKMLCLAIENEHAQRYFRYLKEFEKIK